MERFLYRGLLRRSLSVHGIILVYLHRLWLPGWLVEAYPMSIGVFSSVLWYQTASIPLHAQGLSGPGVMASNRGCAESQVNILSSSLIVLQPHRPLPCGRSNAEQTVEPWRVAKWHPIRVPHRTWTDCWKMLLFTSSSLTACTARCFARSNVVKLLWCLSYNYSY